MLVPFIQEPAAEALNTVLQAPLQIGGWRGFMQAWFGFSDVRLLVRLTVGILVGIGLAATIAFHPRTWGRARDVTDLEHPSALLIYAVIGTVVAQIVAVQPAMAFVVFGIGGLLRFRTVVGEADDTGQVILVTVIGIACGLNLFPLAVLATAAAWILLYRLRTTQPLAFTIEDLAPDQVEGVADQVQATLTDLGFRVIVNSAQPWKRRVKVLSQGPVGVPLSLIQERVEARGTVRPLQFDWDD